MCAHTIQSEQALTVVLFSIVAHRPACLDIHLDIRNEMLRRNRLNFRKMRHSSWGAHLHHESRSILQRCTELSPHTGNTLAPKAALSQGCPLQQEAKSSADQAQAIISGYLRPNLLRTLLNNIGNNAISSTKTISICGEVMLLFKEQPRAECALRSPQPPTNSRSLSRRAPVCVRRDRVPSSCTNATLSCQVCSDPQRRHVLPKTSPACACNFV